MQHNVDKGGFDTTTSVSQSAKDTLTGKSIPKQYCQGQALKTLQRIHISLATLFFFCICLSATTSTKH